MAENLLELLPTPTGDQAEARRRQVRKLETRLSVVNGDEARQLYRVSSEQYELPDLPEVDYLRLPLLLFGPTFVVDVITALRAGEQEVPTRELLIEPLDEW